MVGMVNVPRPPSPRTYVICKPGKSSITPSYRRKRILKAGFDFAIEERMTRLDGKAEEVRVTLPALVKGWDSVFTLE